MTIPTGLSYLIYRRSRFSEARLLIESQRLIGIPTWQDISDLAPEPTEDEIRRVLGNEKTANALVLLSPEVAESEVIQRLEGPLAFARHESQDGFFMVFVLTGGLSYDEAASLLKSRFGNRDLNTWNVSRPERHPLDRESALGVARIVMRQRLEKVLQATSPDTPLRISLHTRSRPPLDTNDALTLDWSDVMEDSRPVSTLDWHSILLPALRLASEQVRQLAHGRELVFYGQASIPAAIALGRAFSLPSGVRAYWLQNKPPTGTLVSWGLQDGRATADLRASTVSGKMAAEDIAVVLSAAQNARPAFDAMRDELPDFRRIVDLTCLSGPLTAQQAADFAHRTMEQIRAARDECRSAGRIHLFASVPLGLAFMLGQLLNAAGPVQTYDYRPTGLVGRYEASGMLE